MDELQLREKWLKQAREMTLEKLPEFINELVSYKHDYGTICGAIAAVAVAAAYAVERSSVGGITRFQASCVMWDMVAGWNSEYEGKPIRLTNYADMLYPQNEENFRTITRETWSYLQTKARERLAESSFMSPPVRFHMERIVAGEVPFGYRVRES